LLIAVAQDSYGQPNAAYGRGFGKGPWKPGFHCPSILMYAPADVLKTKLGLDDRQLQNIEAIRNNFFTKRDQLQRLLEKQWDKARSLWAADLPDQKQVLDHMRETRQIRGRLHEERVKAHLKVLALLTPQQRFTLKAQCPGFGMGRRGGFGHGRRKWGGWKNGRGPGCGPNGFGSYGGGPGRNWDYPAGGNP